MGVLAWPAFPIAQRGGGSTPDAGMPIAPGIYLLAGRFVPGAQPDGNTIIFRAPDGLVAVDTGRHQEHTRRIVDFATGAGRPVAAIINSHWHLDHVGGNALLRERFPRAKVYASGALSAARAGFLANYRAQLQGAISKTDDPAAQEQLHEEVRLIDQGAKLEPDEVIDHTAPRKFAGLALDVHLETHAVTAGDVWLFESKSRTLVAGNLVTLPVPLLDTACPQRWREALDRLAAENFAVLVPGHGATMTRRAFDTYRTAFTNLLACGQSARSKDACASGWLADAGTLLAEQERGFARSLLDYYVDVLRADPATIATRCGR